MPVSSPLILTLALEPSAFAYFDDLRRAYFPAGRNQVPAHVSLFHDLPGAEFDFIEAQVRTACQSFDILPVRVTGLRNLGRGVAFTLESAELARLHRSLAGTFADWLTPQDRQPYRPHITVQNKASQEDAARLFTSLQAGFSPWPLAGVGLALWHYLGGPWQAASLHWFRSPLGGLDQLPSATSTPR